MEASGDAEERGVVPLKPPAGQTEEAVVVAYVRLAPSLKERLRAEADRAGRSFNAEVVRRLEWSLDEAKP